ncbi:MAG: hypothetical protein ACI9R3_000616 [Verrucomicrobiales bacterium]|jgi:hypothetical protein
MKALLSQELTGDIGVRFSETSKLKSWGSRVWRVFLLVTVASWLSNCSSVQKPHNGRFPFLFLESAPGGKRTVKIRGEMMVPAPMPAVLHYNHESPDSFDDIVGQVRAGDMIGFVMSHKQAAKYLSQGNIQKVPYEVFRFGHLSLVTSDRKLLSIAMKQAVTADLELRTLRDQSWIVYRTPAGSIDLKRLDEFVEVVTERASSTSKAYDYTGVIGLWNSGSYPETIDEIADEYTCTTLVLAALNYSGYRVHALHRRGILDIVTPRQVIESSGWATKRAQN